MDDTRWHTSTHSAANGCCVQATALDDRILVRDSKDPGGPRLSFTRPAWVAFLTEVKTGGRLITVV